MDPKKLLNLEYIIIAIATIFLVPIVAISDTYIKNEILNKIIIILAIIIFFAICFICLIIEQKVGFYECKNCNHKYVPKFINVLFAPHIIRTRYMKCQKCNKKSWQKKVLE